MKHKNISIESLNQSLSCHGGLFLLETLYDRLELDKKVRKLLPKKKRKRGVTQVNKFKSLLFAMVLGADSLSDMNYFNKDGFFEALCSTVASRTMGDFLRSFGNRHIERLQEKLTELAIELRLMLFDNNKFILSMDSTPHEHYARQMQGLAFNYKNMWCLDSQNAYDQYGLSYLFDLRPGNTHSGNEAERWVHHVFSCVPSTMDRYFRADSAYSKHAVLKALEVVQVKFAIVLRENIGRYVRSKNSLIWEKTEMSFFGSDECEVAQGDYPVKSLGSFRVVFVRKRLEEHQLELLGEKSDGYKYYSIITNIGSSEMSIEEVFDFYRGRADCENYIKEQKYGFDFLNFPCKSLTANRVFGLIGTFAHNLMRALAMNMEQKVKRVRDKKTKKVKTVTQLGYFAKTVRNTILKIPCRLIRSARTIKLKMNHQNKEVLEQIMTNIQSMFRKVAVKT